MKAIRTVALCLIGALGGQLHSMHRLTRTGLLLLALLLTSSPAGADSLLLAANQWPPFTGRNLPGNGLATELVTTALNRAGYRNEYIEAPWARVIKGLQQDQYDVVLTVWYSAERATYGLFSDAYLVNRIRFLQRRGGDIQFRQISDLYPYRIVVTRGYAYAPAFDNDTRLNKYEVTDFLPAASMVAAGRVELTLEDELVAQYLLRQEPASVREALEFLPTPLAETPLHILVRRSHPQHAQIVADFNRELAAMRADGTYQTILQRHGLN